MTIDDEDILRYWVARLHDPSHRLYTDDGELQCGQCGLDFKRDSIEKIDEKLHQNYTDWLVANADEINKIMEDLAKKRLI